MFFFKKRESSRVYNRKTAAYQCNRKGLRFYHMRKYEEAIEQHRQALNILLEEFGVDDHSLAICYNHLGMSMSRCTPTKYDKIIDYFTKALNIWKNAPEEQYSYKDIAIAHYNLGKVYTISEDYKNATYHYQQAFTTWQEIFDKKHPLTVKCMKDLKAARAAEQDDCESHKNILANHPLRPHS